VRIDTLGTGARTIQIEADEAERAALAQRFGLAGIEALSADAAVRMKGGDVFAEGRLRARVTQSCVASGLPVEAEVDEPFAISFRTQPEAAGEEEIELDEGELDVVFYEGGAVDLGEAVAESLSLALDPYPRAPGAEEALKAAGVKSEEEAGPFAALAALKGKLEG